MILALVKYDTVRLSLQLCQYLTLCSFDQTLAATPSSPSSPSLSGSEIWPRG